MKKFIAIFVAILLSMFTSCAESRDVKMGTDIKSGIVSTETIPVQETPTPSESIAALDGQLKVHFIDVGQADCILIQAPTRTMLIDAGNRSDADTITNYLKGQGVNKIDILIGTHPHEDHIGAMDQVVSTYDIGSVYMPKATATTKTFQDLLTAIKNKGLKVTTARAGTALDLGEGTKAEMLAPNGDSYEDLNNYSAVVKLTYGSTSFLFTGDAEELSEKEMISKGFDLKADVLKVEHHGSNSSTSMPFLQAVAPKFAVISCGKGNDYGHPHKATMDKLKDKGLPVYRTDQCGTIVATSDGNTIKFSTTPGDYSFSGEGTAAAQNLPIAEAKPAEVPKAPAASAKQDRRVYYTPKGKSYHYSKDCRTLARSKTILEGSIEDAINSGHADPCGVCVK